ncbi:hypothetical protein [Nocardia sp. NPDC127526]|uniref:hypothetical protein n=1 Tax=Nocardia sp. NPDC127526 TaxID=3345393 RepID=UPI00362F4ECF
MFDQREQKGGAAALKALPKAERLAILRERMAAVPGRVGATATAPAAAPVAVPAHELLPMPGALGELLPHGGLPRGTVVSCPRGAVVCAALAAASADGQHAAVLCGPHGVQLGLLAVWEMGGNLARVAQVTVPADRAVEVASVLVDGVAIVVLDIPSLRMRPAEVEGLRARIRNKGAVLITTGGEWVRRPHLGFEVRHLGAGGLLGQGCGRVRQLDLEVRVSVQGQPFRRGRVALTGTEDGHTRWVEANDAAAARRLDMVRTG